MRTIYKYPITITDIQRIQVEKQPGTISKILKVGLDSNGFPCVWIKLTPGILIETFEICIVGTGNYVNSSFEYFDSFVQGPFVWHVYI